MSWTDVVPVGELLGGWLSSGGDTRSAGDKRALLFEAQRRYGRDSPEYQDLARRYPKQARKVERLGPAPALPALPAAPGLPQPQIPQPLNAFDPFRYGRAISTDVTEQRPPTITQTLFAAGLIPWFSAFAKIPRVGGAAKAVSAAAKKLLRGKLRKKDIAKAIAAARRRQVEMAGMDRFQRAEYLAKLEKAGKAAPKGPKVGPVTVTKAAGRKIIPLPLPIPLPPPKAPPAAAAAAGAPGVAGTRGSAAQQQAARVVADIRARAGVAAPTAAPQPTRSGATTRPRALPKPTARYTPRPVPEWLTIALDAVQRIGFPQKRERGNPFPPETPAPAPQPQPIPGLTSFGPGGVGYARCECPPKKRKRSQKKPRTVCFTGTYTERADGLTKVKRRKVPCRASSAKRRSPRTA